MFRLSVTLARYRTPWRALLHPLPIRARQSQWLLRDQVEANEASLRKPYYVLCSHTVEQQKAQQELRDSSLVFAGQVGPQLADRFPVPDPGRVRPRYPESWVTVPPQQPSR